MGLNRVQVPILLFIGEEVILEGPAHVLSSSLASSLHAIHFDVPTLSSSRVVIAAIVRCLPLVCFVPVQIVLGVDAAVV